MVYPEFILFFECDRGCDRGRFLKGPIGSFARKKAQLADIRCLLSLNNTYAQNLSAKFLIGPEE
ncbi:MAG: hypothetical protein VR69_15065 [Peptococcaceae bacterium BRH_c4b]|nr:MAG: hypothetical protein VR69_15065 [Peptococcaceae bacterium BRH_c4b]